MIWVMNLLSRLARVAVSMRESVFNSECRLAGSYRLAVCRILPSLWITTIVASVQDGPIVLDFKAFKAQV